MILTIDDLMTIGVALVLLNVTNEKCQNPEGIELAKTTTQKINDRIAEIDPSGDLLAELSIRGKRFKAGGAR